MLSRSVKALVLLLLLSVSSQAMSVFFDSHVSHQGSDDHQLTNNASVSGVLTKIIENPVTDNYGLDCEHCCHCHGAQHIYLPVIITTLHTHLHSQRCQTLSLSVSGGHRRNLLRPPIV
ncbi:MAG: hypothetical protein ACKVI8_05735 [Paraglaciecola sp.]